MKTYKTFMEDAMGAPTNVTGATVSTDQPVVRNTKYNNNKSRNKSKKPEERFVNDIRLFKRKAD